MPCYANRAMSGKDVVHLTRRAHRIRWTELVPYWADGAEYGDVAIRIAPCNVIVALIGGSQQMKEKIIGIGHYPERARSGDDISRIQA